MCCIGQGTQHRLRISQSTWIPGNCTSLRERQEPQQSPTKQTDSKVGYLQQHSAHHTGRLHIKATKSQQKPRQQRPPKVNRSQQKPRKPTEANQMSTKANKHQSNVIRSHQKHGKESLIEPNSSTKIRVPSFGPMDSGCVGSSCVYFQALRCLTPFAGRRVHSSD